MTSPLENELRTALRAAAANVDTAEPERDPFTHHTLDHRCSQARKSAMT